jgi:hypothetical protein
VKPYVLLDPQALLAVTDTEALPVPAVSMMLSVVLLPLHPVPLTDQVYDVAPGTAGMLYIAVALGHGALGRTALAGVAGAAPIGAEKVYALLDPQALLAVTDTDPTTVPAVRLML